MWSGTPVDKSESPTLWLLWASEKRNIVQSLYILDGKKPGLGEKAEFIESRMKSKQYKLNKQEEDTSWGDNFYEIIEKVEMYM